EQHAGDDEGDLLLPLRLWLPGRQRADVLLPDALAVEVAQQRLEDDPQAHRQSRDLAEALPLHFGQRVERSVAEALFEVHGGAHIGDLSGCGYSLLPSEQPCATAVSDCVRSRSMPWTARKPGRVGCPHALRVARVVFNRVWRGAFHRSQSAAALPR